MGGWRASGILTILLHLPWIRVHGSGILTIRIDLPWFRILTKLINLLMIHGSGCVVRAAGFGVRGPRCLIPAPPDHRCSLEHESRSLKP